MRLRELRKSRNLTLKDIGNILNVSESAVSQYENNKREMDNSSLTTLADYFEVTVDYLLGRTDSPDLAIPKDIENMQFAFHGGINTEGLSKEDIDTLKKMADFMRSNKN